jgi:hypothetical protein
MALGLPRRPVPRLDADALPGGRRRRSSASAGRRLRSHPLTRAFSDDEFTDPPLDGVLEAPMEDWMAFIDPTQVKLVSSSFNGPGRICGAAGTGNTVAGLHRAVYLERAAAGRGRGVHGEHQHPAEVPRVTPRTPSAQKGRSRRPHGRPRLRVSTRGGTRRRVPHPEGKPSSRSTMHGTRTELLVHCGQTTSSRTSRVYLCLSA